MRSPSMVRTFVAQISICFALYIALNIGSPQTNDYPRRSDKRALDLYFISVMGGFRPIGEQTILLKQMEKIAMLQVKFVVNISNMGEDDQFMQNATKNFSILKVPWYNTPNSKKDGIFYFKEKIDLPFGQTLDIVGIDTDPLQDSTNDIGKSHLLWLKNKLETMNGTWRIVVGFNPLILCEKTRLQLEIKQVLEPLHDIFTQYGVNAYLSGRSCTHHFRHGSVAYISNPGSVEEEKSSSTGNFTDGFLLHRVSSLEIETHYINAAGEAVYRTSLLHQLGMEVI